MSVLDIRADIRIISRMKKNQLNMNLVSKKSRELCLFYPFWTKYLQWFLRNQTLGLFLSSFHLRIQCTNQYIIVLCENCISKSGTLEFNCARNCMNAGCPSCSRSERGFPLQNMRKTVNILLFFLIATFQLSKFIFVVPIYAVLKGLWRHNHTWKYVHPSQEICTTATESTQATVKWLKYVIWSHAMLCRHTVCTDESLLISAIQCSEQLLW